MSDEYVYSKFSYLTGSQECVYYVKHKPIKEGQDGIWGESYAVAANPKYPGSGSQNWISGGYFGFHDMKMYRLIRERSLPRHLRTVNAKQKGVA